MTNEEPGRRPEPVRSAQGELREGTRDDVGATVELTRREIIKAIGLVPLAGVLGACTSPETDRAARTAAGAGGAAASRTFFTPHERETVRVLVDYIIPRDERSGSATEAKVPEFIDAFLAHPDADPEQGAAIRGGLAWLNAESYRRNGVTFAAANDAQRRAILDDIAYPKRARPEMSHGVAFFNEFRDLTASGFFSSEMGYKDLQFEGNVALPAWNGCPDTAVTKLGVTREVMNTRIPSQVRPARKA